MLNQAVQSSRSIDNAGIRSPETLLKSLPQGLERGSDGCEVIPAQNIHPFKGPHGNYTVAIYHEPNGNTIAFNSNKALYFNLRFFCALHQNHVDSACYSYWYMTFAHELAHNLVSAHNKEHGSFTENIAALYLPDFVKLLSQIS